MKNLCIPGPGTAIGTVVLGGALVAGGLFLTGNITSERHVSKCESNLGNLPDNLNQALIIIKNEVKSDIQKLCAGYDNLTGEQELRLVTADNRVFRIIKDKGLFEEKLVPVKNKKFHFELPPEK